MQLDVTHLFDDFSKYNCIPTIAIENEALQQEIQEEELENERIANTWSYLKSMKHPLYVQKSTTK